MALTQAEALKVAGHAIMKVGEKGEDFENANEGAKWKPSLSEISTLVFETATELGVEIKD